MKTLFIEFDNKNDGYERWQSYKDQAHFFPGSTKIERVHYLFQIGSKKSTITSKVASLYQFLLLSAILNLVINSKAKLLQPPESSSRHTKRISDGNGLCDAH